MKTPQKPGEIPEKTAENTPNSTKRERFEVKIIRITADDSPNVQLAKAQITRGLEPTGEVLLPGVLTWQEYQQRRKNWDKIRQRIGLEAQFYEGEEILLFPNEWLSYAEEVAQKLKGTVRKARAIGCDAAEGGDKTVWAVVDECGIITMQSMKTPDTSVITGRTLALMNMYGVLPERVIFDRGGGGKQHADRLRSQGYRIRTVGFGESVDLEIAPGRVSPNSKIEINELSYIYKNRRAQMYGELSELLNPMNHLDRPAFGISEEYTELRKQLAVIPKLYDQEGRLVMLPKSRRVSRKLNAGVYGGQQRCLMDLIGHSPDEADALVLAVYGMLHKPRKARVGVF